MCSAAPEQKLFEGNFCSLTLSSVSFITCSSSLFLCFCNTVKFIVMQIKFLVVVFMVLLLTTENLVLQDVKITFQQDIIKLMIMSRSDQICTNKISPELKNVSHLMTALFLCSLDKFSRSYFPNKLRRCSCVDT